MKKNIILFAMLINVAIVSAQGKLFSTEKSDEGLRFGIEAGWNRARYSCTEFYSDAQVARNGFNCGITVDIPIYVSLFIKSGIIYSEKGYATENYDFWVGGATQAEGGHWEEHTEYKTTSAGYIQVPVLASYRYNMGERTQLQLNFGPYFACGICGEMYDTGDQDVDSDNMPKRFDWGLQISEYFRFGRFLIGAGYEFGMVKPLDKEKIRENYEEQGKYVDGKQHNLFINVGLAF